METFACHFVYGYRTPSPVGPRKGNARAANRCPSCKLLASLLHNARPDPNIVCVPNMCAQSDAVRAYPKPLKWLSAGHAKLATPDRCGVGMGGYYEVWSCREVTVDLWRRSGALVEARASVPALESGR